MDREVQWQAPDRGIYRSCHVSYHPEGTGMTKQENDLLKTQLKQQPKDDLL